MRGALLRAAPLLMALALAACSDSVARPRPVDTKNDACAWCRMSVSDVRFAAQLAAPGEEPRFFDDVGCLRDYLAGSPDPVEGWAAFVADHRTKEWVPAAKAAYTRVEGLATPMDSHLVAHADAASRDADPEAMGGAPVPVAELFAEKGLPGGKK